MSNNFANTASLHQSIAAADVGPFLEGILIPISNKGQLRVDYDSLYSELSCTLGNMTDFSWTIHKVSDNEISLSPTLAHRGLTLFSSVRPDYDYKVQVQAPFSGDWIVRVAADEKLVFTEVGFLTVNFKGLNDLYLAVGDTANPGYQVHCNATVPSDNTNFFIAPVKHLQSDIELPLINQFSENQIISMLEQQNISQSELLAQTISLAASRS